MLKEWLLNLLYPPCCPGCGAAVSRHGQWCSSCFGAVWRPRRLARKRESRLAACYCLCDYRGPVRTMLQRLKYDGAVCYGRAAEELLTQFPWPERLGHIDCVVPVPLAPEKSASGGSTSRKYCSAPGRNGAGHGKTACSASAQPRPSGIWTRRTALTT